MADVLEEVGLGLVMQFSSLGSEIFGAISSAFGKVDSEIEGAISKAGGLGPGFAAAGTVAAAGIAIVGVAAAGAAVVALKAAGDFQELTTQLVTGAGESRDAIDSVRQGILNLAGEVGQAPEALAKGLYNIESAGYHGAQGLEVLRVAAQGAKVGAADMATVADAVTTALNDYHLPASAAVAVTNDLVATVASGKLHMEDLAGSLSKVLPIAAALGVSFPEVSGAIATMTSQGTDAATATTSLRFLMAALAGPTSAAAKEMKGLGVGMEEIPGITAATSKAIGDLGLHTSDVAATLAKGGLQAALTEITNAIGKKFPAGSAEYEAALKNAVGGTRGLTAALELTGGNFETFRGNVKNISAASKDAGKDVQGWSDVQADFNTKLDQWNATTKALTIELGEKLLPIATRFIDWVDHNAVPAITAIIDWIVRWRAILEPVGIVVGIVTVALAAFAVGSAIATAAMSAFGIAVVIATSPVTLIVLAIVALIAAGVALYENWDKVKAKASEVWGWLNDHISWLWLIAPPLAAMITLIDQVIAHWEGIKTVASVVWSGIVDVIKGAVNLMIGYINLWIRAVDAIKFQIPAFDVGPVHFAAVGFGGLNIPTIPLLDSGGVVAETGLAVVHKGEEYSGVGAAYHRVGGGGDLAVTVQVVGMGVPNDVADEIGRRAADQIMQRLRYAS